MSKKTGYVFGILLTIIIGTILNYFLCCNVNTGIAEEVDTIVAEPEVTSTTKNAFSIVDSQNNSAFKFNDNFNFKTSSYDILEPISEGLNLEVEKLTAYIKENPDKTVDITGFYTSSENNNSAFPNLGLARANAVKNHFVSKGGSSKMINTYGELKIDLNPDGENINYGPLRFGIQTGDTGDDLEALRKEIKADPLILYFDTAQASINLTNTQREKVYKISKYMDKVDNAQTLAVGHTDSEGRRTTNMRLGKNRAEFAKNYLASNGIPSSKIKTSSKGPDQPIANNSSESGRAKNRRVVVTIN